MPSSTALKPADARPRLQVGRAGRAERAEVALGQRLGAARREPRVEQLLGEAELGHARIAPAPLPGHHDERHERARRVAERAVVDAGEALDEAGADRVEVQRVAGQQLARGGHDRLGVEPFGARAEHAQRDRHRRLQRRPQGGVVGAR